MRPTIEIPAERAARYVEQGYWREETLDRWLERWARERGSHDALRHGGRRVTYAELHRLALAFGASLDRLGIGKGDVVAVQLPNCVEFVVAYLGIASRGAVMQTLHMPYRAAELEVLLRHSRARAVLAVTEAKDTGARS